MPYKYESKKIFLVKLLVIILLWFILSSLSVLLVFKSFNALHLKHTIPMITMIFISFLLAIYLLKGLFTYPRVSKALCIFIVILIIYVFLMTLFAILRIYYSRQFILVSFIINNILILGLFFTKKKKTNRRILFLHSENSEREHELILNGIEIVTEFQKYNNDCNGIVLKDFSLLDTHTAKMIAVEMFKGVRVYSFAELYASVTGKIPIESFRPELLRTNGGRLTYLIIKRLFEYIFCLILLFPFFIAGLMISLMIMIEDGRPVLFVQERIGYKGSVFRLIKFRSMKKDAEANGPSFANNNDHRITRVGKLIRKFRLDEIPQIINVIKGDMSLIGPRPEQVPFAKIYENDIPFYRLRYNIRPGLTGWAQIHSGYATNSDQSREKLEYDLYYIFNQSIFLDLIIIFKTIKVILTGHGAI